MTSAEALREMILRVEAGVDRSELPASLVRTAGLAPGAVWNALVSINAVARLEGTDIKAEARARLLAVLRALLSEEQP